MHIHRSLQQPGIDTNLLHWYTHCEAVDLDVLASLYRVHVNWANAPQFWRDAFSAWSTVTILWPVRSFGRLWLFLSPTGDLSGWWQTLLHLFYILEDYIFDNVLQLRLARNVYYTFQIFLKRVLDFAILNGYLFLLTISSGDSWDDIPFFGCFILSQLVLMEWFSFDVNINAFLFWDQAIQWPSYSIF